MARTKAGLTEPDIAALRQQLADGKRPRVQLSGPHFPVEAAGTVVRIGSPETDGADYLRVRVKVNGMTDELAFAPGELSLRRPAGRAPRPGHGRPQLRRPRLPPRHRPEPAREVPHGVPPLGPSRPPADPRRQPTSRARPPADPPRQPTTNQGR